MKKPNLRHALALILSLALVGCAALANVVAAVGPAACGALSAILGPNREYWGTACTGLVDSIAKEIASDIATHPNQARQPCDRLVPIPEENPSAWVCPGFEQPAARAMGMSPVATARR